MGLVWTHCVVMHCTNFYERHPRTTHTHRVISRALEGSQPRTELQDSHVDHNTRKDPRQPQSQVHQTPQQSQSQIHETPPQCPNATHMSTLPISLPCIRHRRARAARLHVRNVRRSSPVLEYRRRAKARKLRKGACSPRHHRAPCHTQTHTMMMMMRLTHMQA